MVLFGLRLKLLLSVRLIPMVERNSNLAGIGPRDTGKSFVYRETTLMLSCASLIVRHKGNLRSLHCSMLYRRVIQIQSRRRSCGTANPCAGP